MFAEMGKTVVAFPELGLGPWELDRYAVKDLFGFLSVAWYGLIICLGMILGCAVVLYGAVKREKLNLDSFLDYFIFAIPFGVIGARVMYVLARLEHYETFSEMIAIWNGGIAIYGAVIAGAITVLVVAKIKKQNPLLIFDVMVPGLMLAQAIGRWGNFVNGEAHGEVMEKVLPWGMMVNGIGPVHPTFLYESLITLTGFFLSFFLLYRLKKAHGQIFCFYLVWYGLGRFFVEGLRTDSLMIGSLRLAQCIGLLSVLLGIVLFCFLTFYKPKEKVEGEEKSEGNPTSISEADMEEGALEGDLPQEHGGEEKHLETKEEE